MAYVTTPTDTPVAPLHIDHVADIAEVYVPWTARKAVAELQASGEGHVWWWPLPELSDPADDALLDAVERGRARRFHAERDAAAFARTRAGARRAVAALLGVDPEDVTIGRRVCPGCGDKEHGPPAVVRPPVPLAVSLSRTLGCGVLALRAGDWVGVDVEALRPVESRALAELVLTARERNHLLSLESDWERTLAFHRAWTRKEAVVKAVGLGLLGMELNALDVNPAQEGPVEVLHVHKGEHTRWWVEDINLRDQWAAAIARPLDGGARLGPLHTHHPVEGS
ncbi:4'-phosphopantetheinyl transferase [Streptacidiphilus sp. MAP12-33]|uniref:4'-phosphopantetheinyl transferase family protein n=1 Tax=Streptacidiphilus sp. MAP12-33 TaxID=3156266 RepID=UPI0035166877